MEIKKRALIAISLSVVLSSLNSDGQRSSSTVEKQVSLLIVRIGNRSTEQQSFADLEALGCQAIPAIIKHMDDRRRLPNPRVSLRNKSPQAFEGLRHYGPQEVVDALAAILNQITGQDFGFIYKRRN
jgi:hypothetical protein